MLRVMLIFSLCLIVASLVYGYLNFSSGEHHTARNNLPWQIDTDDKGNIQVFGLVPGRSTLEDVIKLSPEDHDLAIISGKKRMGGLEVYLPSFNAGPLKGKLIVTADLPNEQLMSMIARASYSSYTSTGARKYLLNSEDLAYALLLPLKSMSFIPTVNLDKAIILQQFGQPAEILTVSEQVDLYLYPAKGLLISLNKAGKESLQYIAPQYFDLLVKVTSGNV